MKIKKRIGFSLIIFFHSTLHNVQLRKLSKSCKRKLSMILYYILRDDAFVLVSVSNELNILLIIQTFVVTCDWLSHSHHKDRAIHRKKHDGSKIDDFWHSFATDYIHTSVAALRVNALSFIKRRSTQLRVLETSITALIQLKNCREKSSSQACLVMIVKEIRTYKS